MIDRNIVELHVPTHWLLDNKNISVIACMQHSFKMNASFITPSFSLRHLILILLSPINIVDLSFLVVPPLLLMLTHCIHYFGCLYGEKSINNLLFQEFSETVKVGILLERI